MGPEEIGVVKRQKFLKPSVAIVRHDETWTRCHKEISNERAGLFQRIGQAHVEASNAASGHGGVTCGVLE